MRKSLLATIGAVMLFLGGCGKPYMIIENSSVPLKPYGKFVVLPVDNKDFLTNKVQARDEKDMARYQSIVNEASDIVRNLVQSKLTQLRPGTGPVAYVQITLTDYSSGSGALRFFVGGNAGKGVVAYNVQVYDSKNKLGRCHVSQEITGTMFGADKFIAFRNVAVRINSYFVDMLSEG